MKFIALIIASNIASILAVWCAWQLASDGKDGWGWFLIVALCATTTIRVKDKQ